MYVYIQTENELWTVGFYSPNGKWNPESDHTTKNSAASRVHYLNGGIKIMEEPKKGEINE